MLAFIANAFASLGALISTALKTSPIGTPSVASRPPTKPSDDTCTSPPMSSASSGGSIAPKSLPTMAGSPLKPVAIMPPALFIPVLCSDLAKARDERAAHPSYGYALVQQRLERLLAGEVNKIRATFRIVR
ncbi:hypothetical protein LGH82_33105 [Mesorhizobium sp. PAMC28654]|uniref:hypothetical protein n=1 Tax=Mesorhizobium sp. PAMC28654 TaxID=2880934 RepID=UPI001D0B4E4B|nr:hypothetical protein [Mesorhizobium sp. PAMC28654]UDL89820.1 hypothetical protein LGH82_33105 [Mesorhizobium sp. PAMC28654]